MIPAILTEGYADAFLAGAALAVIGLIATLVLIRGEDLAPAHMELGDGEPEIEGAATDASTNGAGDEAEARRQLETV